MTIIDVLLFFFALASFAVACALLFATFKISRPSARSQMELLGSVVGRWSNSFNGTMPGVKNHAVLTSNGMGLVEGGKNKRSEFINQKRLSDEAISSVLK
jgi:hypothetical protein